MKTVIQRVSEASVRINGELHSSIGKGMLLFICVEKGDDEESVRKMIDKLLKLRIFEDNEGKMNYNIKQVRGEFLAVSQFTLSADLSKGNRPSFDNTVSRHNAEKLYSNFVNRMKSHAICKDGKFGEYMQIEMINDGPVTFCLEI